MQCTAGQSVYGLDEHGVCAGLKWDEQKQQYRCLLILETLGKAHEAAKEGLAIGAGCSSSLLNTQRDETLARLRKDGTT